MTLYVGARDRISLCWIFAIAYPLVHRADFDRTAYDRY